MYLELKNFDHIKNKFCEMDSDGDGKVTPSEIKAFFAEQKCSDDEIDWMMRMTDKRWNFTRTAEGILEQTVEFYEFFFMMSPIAKKMRSG